MFKTRDLPYHVICNHFGLDSMRTWAFCLGLNEDNEYVTYSVLDPFDSIQVPIDIELGFFFEMEDYNKGFLPFGASIFTIEDQIVYNSFNPFYAPEIEQLPESKKSVDPTDPFSVLEQLNQIRLAKKFILYELSVECTDQEKWQEFANLLDSFYFVYLMEFITNENVLKMLKFYQNMEKQLTVLGEKPNKIITEWID